MGTYDHAPHFALVAMSRLSIFEVQCCRILVGEGKNGLLCFLFSFYFLSCLFFFYIFSLNYLKSLYQTVDIRVLIVLILYGYKFIHHPNKVTSMLLKVN